MISIEAYNPVQTTPFSLKVKLKSKLWKLINRTFFRISIPRNRSYRVWLLKLFGANVDWSCNIHSKSNIDFPWNLEMGYLSSVGENSWIYCLEKVKIGQKTCIGKDVYLLTGSHNVSSLDFSYELKPIIIRDGVWISTGVYVLPGVEIADFSVIASNSTVTKNVPQNSIVGGTPARFLKYRF